jgi:hypothetical protein
MPALKVVVMPNKLAVDEGNSALLSKTTAQTPSTHRWLKMSSLFYYFDGENELVRERQRLGKKVQ